mgnify:CR=1 FL=1
MTKETLVTKVTLQTLAEELGVSRQTVSNALNAPDKVHPTTLERVRAAIDRTGYRPSAAARALRRQRSMQLGLRLREAGDGINGTVMDGFLHALVGHAAQRGYGVSLFTARDRDHEVSVLRQLFETGAIDGCVLTDTCAGDSRPQALTDLAVPFVAFGRPWGELNARHHWCDVDGRAGTRAAVAFLRRRGRTRIGYIGWPDEAGIGVERRLGWADATGADPDRTSPLEVVCTDEVALGASAATTLVAAGVDGIVCASDSLAIGALSETRRHGDIDVVGFDDTPVARALGLTSLRQPMAEAAHQVLGILLDVMAGEASQPRHVLLEPTLQPRTVAEFL